MKNSRKEDRMYVTSYLKVIDSTSLKDIGRVFDITPDGMRLQGSEPIETHSSCQFEMSVPPKLGMDRRVRFDADVIWCRKSPRSGYFDVGLQLKDVPAEVSDVIDRIIEKTPFLDRNLHVHHPRPLEH